MTPATLNLTIARGAAFDLAIYCYGPDPITITAATTLGSSTVTVADTGLLAADMGISGSGIPKGAVISSITNSTTFVISAEATATHAETELTAREPVDITGWTAFAEVRASSAGAVIADLAPTVDDGPAGKLVVSLTANDTEALTAGTYRWDLLLQPDGEERMGPFVSGEVKIKTPITQP